MIFHVTRKCFLSHCYVRATLSVLQGRLRYKTVSPFQELPSFGSTCDVQAAGDEHPSELGFHRRPRSLQVVSPEAVSRRWWLGPGRRVNLEKRRNGGREERILGGGSSMNTTLETAELKLCLRVTKGFIYYPLGGCPCPSPQI